jgi:hypothetical protein
MGVMAVMAFDWSVSFHNGIRRFRQVSNMATRADYAIW